MRRKSIARRRPLIVFRAEPDENDATVFHVRAWIGDDVTGRLDRDRYIGNVRATEYAGTAFRGQWLDNTDTEAIHDLPDDVRDAIWSLDDAAREALKRGQL